MTALHTIALIWDESAVWDGSAVEMSNSYKSLPKRLPVMIAVPFFIKETDCPVK